MSSKLAERFEPAAFAYGHRGLWAKSGIPENSLAAFRAACDQGLGIEFDVRPSADGEIMVFHDETLSRMTSADGNFADQTKDDLKTLTLKDTAEHIPTLQEVLDSWNSKAPLLVEMKIDGATDPAAFAMSVAAMLESYTAPAAAMSFDWRAVRALPDTLQRGLLIAPIEQTSKTRFDRAISVAREIGVDYLGLWKDDIDQAPEDLPAVVWTVASETALAALPARKLGIIFEHFDPALVRP